jgi:hypothetical protein
MGADGQQVIDIFAEAARHARCGDYSQAAGAINSSILKFKEFMQQQGASEQYKKFGPRMTYSLETLLMMLERKDWVAAADVIDYEFIPLWKEAFSP